MPAELHFDQRTLEENLRAMEARWADLCRQEENVPVPQWHPDLLDERERLIQSGKAQFHDWQTARQRISERAG